jgi:hypothetical protein
MDLTKIYRTFYPTATEYTLISLACENFSRTDYILLWDYYEKLYAYTLESLEEIDNYVYTFNHQNWTKSINSKETNNKLDDWISS